VAAVTREEVAVWDMTTGRKRLLFHRDGKRTNYHLSLCPDGRTLVAHELCRGAVELWDLGTQKQLRRFALPITEAISTVVLSPDGLALAGHHEDVLRLWDATDGKPLLDFPGHVCPPVSLSWSADGKKLASEGEELFVWDVNRQEPLSRALVEDGRSGGRFNFRFSPGCDWAAWAGATDVHLYDVRRRKLVHELPGDGGDITDFDFAPCGGRIVTAEKRGTARIWDVHTGELVREIDTRSEAETISWLVFTPDGATLATGDGPARVHLWETATGRHLATLTGDEGNRKYRIREGCWERHMASDGKTLFTSSDGEVFVWDLVNRKEVGLFQDEKSYVGRSWSLPISVSPDVRLLAQFDRDDSLHLWEMASGRVAYSFGRGYWYSDAAFAPAGRRLATGCEEDGSILVWDLPELFLSEQRRSDGDQPRGLTQAWQDLASGDAPRAYQAIGLLVSSGKAATDLLGKRLRPVPEAKADEAAAWLGQLDNPEFEVRAKATQRLQELREGALPFLERARDGRPTLEVWRRLEGLRGALDARSAESLREIRAVQVLEYLGTEEARRLLHRLAMGLPEARLTREAQGALGRLNRRPTP
jgi:WD40 repeat protein